MIETTIRWILLNDPAIAALVSDRVLPVFNVESQSMPAITYSRSGTTRIYDARKATGQIEASIDLTCWSNPNGDDPYGSAWALFDLVRLCLSGWTETPAMRSRSGGATERVRRLFVQNDQDVVVVPQAGEGKPTLGVSCDLEVTYAETVRAYQ